MRLQCVAKPRNSRGLVNHRCGWGRTAVVALATPVARPAKAGEGEFSRERVEGGVVFRLTRLMNEPNEVEACIAPDFTTSTSLCLPLQLRRLG